MPKKEVEEHMAEIEIALKMNGDRVGRVVYELTNEASGEGHVVSISCDDPGLEDVLRRDLTGNPHRLVVASRPVAEIAETSDGVYAALNLRAELDNRFEFDRDALPYPPDLAQKGFLP